MRPGRTILVRHPTQATPWNHHLPRWGGSRVESCGRTLFQCTLGLKPGSHPNRAPHQLWDIGQVTSPLLDAHL